MSNCLRSQLSKPARNSLFPSSGALPRWMTVLAIAACVGACGGGESEEKSGKAKKKDFGSASVLIDGVAWEATSCSARLKGENMKISCSRMDTDREAGKTSRQSLDLLLKDYKGEGEYTASPGASTFIGVGLNTGALEAAEDDAAKATEALTATLGKSTYLRLGGTGVNITEVSAKTMDGTFANSSPGNPTLADGRFHAIIKEPR